MLHHLEKHNRAYLNTRGRYSKAIECSPHSTREYLGRLPILCLPFASLLSIRVLAGGAALQADVGSAAGINVQIIGLNPNGTPVGVATLGVPVGSVTPTSAASGAGVLAHVSAPDKPLRSRVVRSILGDCDLGLLGDQHLKWEAGQRT